MVFNSSLILFILSITVLILCLLLLIRSFVKELKTKSDEDLILMLVSGIIIILLIPVILGIIQDL